MYGPRPSRVCCPNGWSGEFSPPLRGGVAARSRKRREASLARADGVVFNLNKIPWNLVTTPSAPSRRLRDILLISRPPLLGEEGKIADLCFLDNSAWKPAPTR